MVYQVLYSNGDLFNTTVVDIGRCLMDECSTPGSTCSNDDVICCCQPLDYSQLQFISKAPVIYNRVVSACGCMPCLANMSFVGAVTRDGVPMPLASLVVDHTLPFLTDRHGYFEAVASGQQSKLTVTPIEYGYASLNYTFPVVLGSINIVAVELVPVTATPSSADNIVLDMTGLSDNGRDQDKITSLVYFPPEFFSDIEECHNSANNQSDNCMIQYIPVDMASDESILKFRLDFLAQDSEQERSKRQAGAPRCVSVYALGWVQVFGDSGQEVSIEMSRGINITTFIDSSLHFAESLQLYQYSSDNVFTPFNSTPMATEVDGGVKVTYHLSPTPLPLIYIIAAEVDKQCYTVVRVFRMKDSEIDQERELRYLVSFVTRTTMPRMVSVVRGYSKECVNIPCNGELSVAVHHYNTLFYPNTIQYSLPNTFPTLPGPIYSSLDDCTMEGAVGTNAMLYFSFIETSSLPSVSPVDSLVTNDNAGIYCYIQLEVYTCADHFTRVMVTSSQEDGQVDRVRYLSSSPDIDVGSGMGCVEQQVVCMEYDCDVPTNVTISVAQCDKDSCLPLEYKDCFPASYPYNLFPLTSPAVSYDSSTVTNTKGTFSSMYNADIAYYKCKLTPEVAVVFQCNLDD